MSTSACSNVFKGYSIATGYMGWVPWYGRYMLFTTQDEYYEYVRGEENEDEYSNKNYTASN